MQPNEKSASYRMLVLIATPKLADKAADLFARHDLPVQFRLNAEGTASSDILDTLGLGGVDKCLLLSTLPRAVGKRLLRLLHTELRLDAAGSGIAFTMPLTGASNLVLRMMDATGEKQESLSTGKGDTTMVENAYTLICAAVDRGFGGDAMDAARAAGAGGGTIVHSRSIESSEATGFWGLSMQEEKELVLILAPLDEKISIMRAITEKCGMHSKAKGLVVSLPIDEVMGI